MSTYFSKVIKAGDRQREFNFRLLSGPEPRYHVDVPDERGNRVVFSMVRNDSGEWKNATDALPNWVQDAEPRLGLAIEEHAEESVRKPARR